MLWCANKIESNLLTHKDLNCSTLFVKYFYDLNIQLLFVNSNILMVSNETGKKMVEVVVQLFSRESVEEAPEKKLIKSIGVGKVNSKES